MIIKFFLGQIFYCKSMKKCNRNKNVAECVHCKILIGKYFSE